MFTRRLALTLCYFGVITAYIYAAMIINSEILTVCLSCIPVNFNLIMLNN